jgi:beta-lactamase class D
MKNFVALMFICCSCHSVADDWIDSPEIAALFSDTGVDGAFVLYDLAGHRMFGYNEARASYRYTPASTFEIPHTLIGLSTGAVANLDEVLPYGGQRQVIDSWESDMSLRQAIAASNPAIYQALARRIGPVQMQQHISALIYGNREFGSTLRPFWSEGPLLISAVEQTRFLALLVQDALPYPLELLKSVRDQIRIERGEGWTLYAKTAWQNAPGPGIGWWVGWIEKDGQLFTFALNMDINRAEDAARPEQLGRASLRVLKML